MPEMIMVNLMGGPGRMAKLESEGVEYYYFVNTPETPNIYQNIIEPSIQAMKNSSIYRGNMQYAPQILVNVLDYSEKNNPQNMTGHLIIAENDFYVSGEYHPETNVIVTNIAIGANYGRWGGDMTQLIQLAVESTFMEQRSSIIKEQYNWTTPANPIVGKLDKGLVIFAPSCEIADIKKYLGDDYQLTYPTDDELVPIPTS